MPMHRIRELSAFCIAPEGTIRDAMLAIERNGEGIVLVVDAERRLLETVTDGDVRRAILAGVDLGSPMSTFLEQRATARLGPLTAPVGIPDAHLLKMMTAHGLRHIPLVDEELHVVDVALLSQLVRGCEAPLAAVIMAGGYGIRLRPLTADIPKPMLSVGAKPVMERIIGQLRAAGIRQVIVTTHYKAEVITKHFGDGHDFGVEISYVNEERPRGTAGALALMADRKEPLLVINGDILTGLNFRALTDFHLENRADMTVSVRHYEVGVPYGVVEPRGVEVERISEKPILRFLINAGVYVLQPSACDYIPDDKHFDMTDLIQRLLGEGKRVV